MGFRPQSSTALIEFVNPEHPFHGLQMRCRGVTVEGMLETAETSELRGLQAQLSAMDPADVTPGFVADVVGRIRKPFEQFADSLVEWNMEDAETGEAVPATIGGILSLDLRVAVSVIREWQTAMSGVSSDLKADSPSGQSAPVLDLPMDPL